MPTSNRDSFVFRDTQDERLWLSMDRGALNAFVAKFETLNWSSQCDDYEVYSSPDNYTSGTFIRNFSYWISVNVPNPDQVTLFYREKLDYNNQPYIGEDGVAIYDTNSDNINGAAVLSKHHLSEFILTAKRLLIISSNCCNI